MTQMMRAAVYERCGPAAEVLRCVEVPRPEPGPGEVRVRLYASGVNPSDVKSRRGPRPMPYPRIIPHSDGAGEIDAVGSGTGRRVGERVWIWNGQWQRPYGTAAQYICVPSIQAVALPDNVSFEVGACLGIPALTAWRAVHAGTPVAGQTLLVAGGAGAVGHYAIQMAKRAGAHVITSVSSPEKAAHARAAGADWTVDYHHEDLGERVAALTQDQGVDRVIEVNLVANARFYTRITRPGARVIVYGSDRWDGFELPLRDYLVHGLALEFFIVYELSQDERRAGLGYLDAALAAGMLEHTIGARFTLEHVVAAHEAVEHGQVIGNVVVTLP